MNHHLSRSWTIPWNSKSTIQKIHFSRYGKTKLDKIGFFPNICNSIETPTKYQTIICDSLRGETNLKHVYWRKMSSWRFIKFVEQAGGPKENKFNRGNWLQCLILKMFNQIPNCSHSKAIWRNRPKQHYSAQAS